MGARRNILAVATAVAALTGPPAAAFAAEDDYTKPPEQVRGTSFSRPAEVQGVTVSRDPGDPGDPGLPVTGGDLAGMTLLGLAAVGVGSVLVRRGRTPRESA